MTNDKTYALKVDLWDLMCVHWEAIYTVFKLADQVRSYSLVLEVTYSIVDLSHLGCGWLSDDQLPVGQYDATSWKTIHYKG